MLTFAEFNRDKDVGLVQGAVLQAMYIIISFV